MYENVVLLIIFVLFILNVLFVLDTDDTYICEFCLKAPLTQVDGTTKSEKFYMNNIPWFLTTYVPMGHPDYLSIRLNCDVAVEFSFKFNFSVKIISIVNKKHDISYGPFETKFPFINKFVGLVKFVELDDLHDKAKGLMKNGMITVKIKAKFIK